MSFRIETMAGEQPPLAEINMVPLIDVMMVLLVIFLVTAPLLTQSVTVRLPHAASTAEAPAAQAINISIDNAGALYWNAQAIDRPALQQRLQRAGQNSAVPTLRIQADRNTPYEKVAQVMADASRAGIDRIGFVSLPEHDAQDKNP